MGKKLTKPSCSRGDEFKYTRTLKLQMEIGPAKYIVQRKFNLMRDLWKRLARRMANDDAIVPMHRL